MVKKRGKRRGKRRGSSKEKRNHHESPTKHETHPSLRQELTFGQRAADWIAKFGGSWIFISIFALFLIAWMILNTFLFLNNGFDPYPYILLNLVLSCVAAFQAPIILMAQGRQGERDRIDAKYDHAVNRKAEREIKEIQKDLAKIKVYLRDLRKK